MKRIKILFSIALPFIVAGILFLALDKKVFAGGSTESSNVIRPNEGKSILLVEDQGTICGTVPAIEFTIVNIKGSTVLILSSGNSEGGISAIVIPTNAEVNK